MIRWLRGRLCPRCLEDTESVETHPAITSMQRSGRRLDHLLRVIREFDTELEARPSGNTLRDLAAGTYGGDDDA